MTSVIAVRPDSSLEPLVSPPWVRDGVAEAASAVSLQIAWSGDSWTGAGTLTLDASAQRAVYAWSAADIAKLTANLPALQVRVTWSVTVPSGQFRQQQVVDIVDLPLITSVTTADLIGDFPALDDALVRVRHEVVSGATADSLPLKGMDPFLPGWVDADVLLLTGVAQGQRRRVASIDQQNRAARLVDALAEVPVRGDVAQARLSLKPVIDAAWATLQRMIIDTVGRENLRSLSAAGDLAECHRWLALSMALEQASESASDGFALALPRIRRRFADGWQQLDLAGDSSLRPGVAVWTR